LVVRPSTPKSRFACLGKAASAKAGPAGVGTSGHGTLMKFDNYFFTSFSIFLEAKKIKLGDAIMNARLL
jgi:hypothetical protein